MLIKHFASLLDEYSTKNLKNLQKLHACVIRHGVADNDFIRSKLVSSYASCSQIVQATLLFSLTIRRPTFLYNSLIRAYASQSRFWESLFVFRCLILAGKAVDKHTLPVVLKSCSGLSNLRVGRQVHGAVLVNGFGSEVGNCNGLITMYAKCGDLPCAVKVFDEMPERNEVSWTAMMSGFGFHGKHAEVLMLFDKMVEVGMKVDGLTFTSLLMACGHVGEVERAREYFQMMQDRFGVRQTVEHYTCMVDMLGKAGLIDEAKDLVMDMKAEPDGALWRALLTACRIHKRVDVAEWANLKMLGDAW
ncbi:PREDICTED: putative pentatricopeptide repeat-containing protein At3g23330 [Tarenaya hassleriana]|uniref:putative pentatricopeptide repeat-containing protein At3g23330 n=1 Tax=Tarenaya hassleriana TaxID=28532 RepID=UPI00053C2639|nr:PREDICTED: putative pentatricopeptide repeat-containing protein At3g23330 [Tarenaya hassleriana]